MSDTITLSEEEIRRATGYKRPGDQLSELHRLGFYRARRSPTTGRVILERGHYDAVLTGGGQATNDGRRRPALRAV